MLYFLLEEIYTTSYYFMCVVRHGTTSYKGTRQHNHNKKILPHTASLSCRLGLLLHLFFFKKRNDKSCIAVLLHVVKLVI